VGTFDEAMMRFLQSDDKEEEIFKQVVVKYNKYPRAPITLSNPP
jgi:hypothetical protein